MINIHPEFDASTNTWFWNEFEAATLRQLKKLIGPGVRIMDYYQDGFGAVIAMQFIVNEKKKEAVRVMPPSVANLCNTRPLSVRKRESSINDKRRFNGGNNRRLTHDHDKILDMWAKGMPTKLIAAQCIGLSEAVARSTVMLARRKGDPRAVRRIPEKS